MSNKKDSEIAWIDIGDKIKKEWKINVQKEEEDGKSTKYIGKDWLWSKLGDH